MNKGVNSSAELVVVGLGPGDASQLSPEAKWHLENCQVIVGYSGYVALLDPVLCEEKQVISTGMMGEMSRAEAAIDAALEGKKTVVVCSGDPGIYALAGLVLELLEVKQISSQRLSFAVVPGVPAVCAAAALLGAPLMHDFACVSLSDLLTPWDVIVRRLQGAFVADFVVALYNPQSKRRTSQLRTALDIALEHKSGHTPVGIVKSAYREEQEVILATLATVPVEKVDMFSIVIIGNSSSRFVRGNEVQDNAWKRGTRMLTPRGYLKKYTVDD